RWKLSQSANADAELEIASVVAGRRELYGQILAYFKQLGKSAPTDHEIRQSIVRFFASLFRTYGIEIADAILDKETDESKTSLSCDNGDAVVASTVPHSSAPI